MAKQYQPKLTVLRRKQVEDRTGLSRSTIYLRIQEGTFPKPVNLGGRAVGWVEEEIDTWLEACIERRDVKITQSGKQDSIIRGY